MRLHPSLILSSIGVAGLCCGVATAQPLLDNLDQPIQAATVFGTLKADAIWAAQSFGSHSTFRLVSIEVPLGNAIDSPDAFAELRRGEDPTGPAIAIFPLPALSETGLELVTLVPDTDVVIEPDVLYWLVTGTVTVGSYEWSYAMGNLFVGSGYFGSYWYSFDLGATWIDFGGDNPYHIRVNVSSECRGDFNTDGFVNSQDFFDFLAAFFAQDPIADFNHDIFIDSQDIFDFLAAFFEGC